jgi:ribonuclease P protein component
VVLEGHQESALISVWIRMKYGKIKRSWQFRKIYKEGVKYFDNLFVLYVLPNNTQETRIGLTVTKKVGISVQRNRIKRLIREVFRSLSEIAPGNDLVIIARKAALNLKYSQVQASLNRLLYRAGILRSGRN